MVDPAQNEQVNNLKNGNGENRVPIEQQNTPTVLGITAEPQGETSIDKAIASGAETLGVFAATALTIFTVTVLAFFIAAIRNKISKSITISLNSGEAVLEFQLKMWQSLSELKQQFPKMRRSLPTIWLLPNTKIDFGRLVDPAFLGSGSVDFKFGDAELKGFDVLIRQFMSKKNEFVLRLMKANSDSADKDWILFALQNSVGITSYGKVMESGADSAYEVASSIAAALASKETDASAEFENLFKGLFYLSRYFAASHNVSNLNSAADQFDIAAKHPDLRTQATLLALTCARLAQNRPSDVRIRLESFLDNVPFRDDKLELGSRDAILVYQKAVSLFYTYSPDAISESVVLFDRIPQPGWYTRLLVRVGSRKFRRVLALFLLAKADAAIAVAHKQVHRQPTDTDTLEDLQADLKTRLDQLRTWLEEAPLSPTDEIRREINWRILNAEAASTYTWKIDDVVAVRRAQESAKRAYQLSVYCLDPRANEATLYLQEAVLEENQEKRTALLTRAEGIFLELFQTGWDPGYVQFRLSQIFRQKGKFSKARKCIRSAAKPEVLVVSADAINLELARIRERQKSLNLSDL